MDLWNWEVEIKTKFGFEEFEFLIPDIQIRYICTFRAIYFLFVCSVYCLRFKRFPILFILQLDVPMLVPSHWFVPAVIAISGQ